MKELNYFISPVHGIYRDGSITEGNKLASKNEVVNTQKRQENQHLTDFYKELVEAGAVENMGQGRNGGYFAKVDYNTAQSLLNNSTTTKGDF